MKKIICILFILTLMLMGSSCQKELEDKTMLKYESGIYYNKNWDDPVGTYSKKSIISDKETAVKVAKAIFDGMDISKDKQDYIPQKIFYDENDKVWIVSFWENSEQVIVGGDCNIAIQEKDGKVLRVWFGE